MKVKSVDCDCSMSKNITSCYGKLKAINRTTSIINGDLSIHKSLTLIRVFISYLKLPIFTHTF